MKTTTPRRLSVVMGNTQSLDGGAMFGNAPKALWSRWLTPDADNRVALCCRALLVQEAERTLLFETGVGAFFTPELRDRYGVIEPEHILLESLNALGVDEAAIDIVVLSHLHFDHAGGCLAPWQADTPARLLFPNAQFIVSDGAWLRANQPHPRDKASFIPALQPLLEQSKRLHRVDGASSALLGPDYRLHYSQGHTPGLLMTEISMPKGPVLFVSDLIPGAPWVHLPITMGYDRCAEQLIDEKTALLTDLKQRGGRLFYTHDPNVALSHIEQDDRGRFCAGESLATFSQLTD